MATETLYVTSLTSGSVTSSSNVQGAPNGTWTSDTGATSWTARFAMGNPVGNQANGTHTITVRARKEAGQSGTPSITSINLYALGVLLGSIGASPWNITSTTGQDIAAAFANTLLSGVNLSNVEVEVVTTAAGGSPSARCSVQIDAITWSGDFTTAAPPVQTMSPTGIASAAVVTGGSGGVVGAAGHVSDTVTGIPVEPEAHTHDPALLMPNGALYRVMESSLATGNHPIMMKSTDGGATWAQAGALGTGADLEALTVSVDGTVINTTICPDSSVWWEPFDTATDTWLTRETVDTGLSSSGVAQGCFQVRLSDGTHWIFYSDTLSGTNQQIAYRKRTGTNTYGAKVSGAFGSTATSSASPKACVGASDVTYVVYTDDTNNHVYMRTLTAAGVLSTAIQVDDAGAYAPTAYLASDLCVRPIYYDDGGVEVISVFWANPSGFLMLTQWRNGVKQASEQVNSSALVYDAAATTNDAIIAHCDFDPATKTIYVVYAEEATGKLFMKSRASDGTWSAATTIYDPPTVDASYYAFCSFYTRAGTKRLGVAYDKGAHGNDVSYVDFAEVSLAASGPVVTFPVTAQTMTPTGVASAQALGNPTAAVGSVGSTTMSPTGVASAGAFGTTVASLGAPPAQTMTASGVATGEAFGSTSTSAGGGAPATPILRGTFSASATATGPTASVTLPAGIQTGDIGLVITSKNTGADTITAPSGWEIVAGPIDNGSIDRSYLLRRTMAASDSGTTLNINWSSTGRWTVAGAIVGNVQAALDSVTLGTDTTRDTDLSVPSFTPVASDTFGVLLAGAQWAQGLTTGLATSPPNWTEREDSSTAFGTGANMGSVVCTRQISGSAGVPLGGSTGTWGGAAVNNQWVVTLAPVAGGGPSATTMTPTAVSTAEAFGSATAQVISPTTNAAPSAVASVEAFGVAVLAAKVTSSPTAVGSSEAFGTALIAAKVTSTAVGIASGEAFGTTVVTAKVVVSAVGIASIEAFGVTALAAKITSVSVGISSGEALGTPSLSAKVTSSPTGLASAEAFGPVSVSIGFVTLSLAPVGIASAQALGSTIVSTSVGVSPASMASAQAIGTPLAVTVVTVAIGGVASAEAIGNPSVAAVLASAPLGIVSAEALGSPSLVGRNVVVPTGVASLQAFGVTVLSTRVTATAIGIASAQAIGTPSAASGLNVGPTPIASGEAVGNPTLGTVLVVSAVGVSSAQAFGIASILANILLSPAGLGSSQAFGQPSASALPPDMSVSPSGIPTGAAFGVPALASILLSRPLGVVSAEAFGAVFIGGKIILVPMGIGSGEGLGDPSVRDMGVQIPAMDPVAKWGNTGASASFTEAGAKAVLH